MKLVIQRDYLDHAGRPATLPPETVEALRAALGGPGEDLAARGPLIAHPGDRLDVAAPVCGVTLEDGTETEIEPTAPLSLPLGYHWLDDGMRRRLIVSPGRCTLPTEPGWVWTAQLYATRSRASWGIGDLADLARLTELARAQGAGFVLVNPLHQAGCPAVDAPQQPSPYLPSSRRFLNPLLIAVPHVDGAGALPGTRLAELAAAGETLNADRGIDRDAVWRLKHQALREIFDRTDAARRPAFAAWRRERGPALEEFAVWWVLAQRHHGSWRRWPAGARRPEGHLARAVREQPADDVAFAAWLQWQAQIQLRAAGRQLPVLQDLPVGVDPDGADAWAYQDLLADGVTIGAPPDPFNRAGQDWALPPFVPWRLRAADYEPFVAAVRATMALAGGLRIDHVMGLFRLWWIPGGCSADRGGYIRYPAHDLLDIVSLESARAAAPVVGEDLGTVEPGVREELAARNLLSYRLLWFEDSPPTQWPEQALAAVSTHDLPTVAGLWDGSDLADQRRHGLPADAVATERLRQLVVDRAGVPPQSSSADAVLGAYRLLAQAPCVLRAASVDDALAEPSRPNMPGSRDRANWSRALAVPLEELPNQPGFAAIAATLGGTITGG